MRQPSSCIAVVAAALSLLLSAMLDYQRQVGVNAAIVQSGTQKRAVLNVGARDAAMVLIPGASFQMGTSASEIPNLQKVFGIKRADLFAAEVPQHTVTIDSFYLDRYEVTNVEFKEFIEKNLQWRQDRISSRYHNGNYLKHWNGNDYPKEKARHPVTNVSWYALPALLWLVFYRGCENQAS